MAKDLAERHEAIVACEAVLDLLRPSIARAWIDAYSDYRDDLPPDIEQAQDWLRRHGESSGQGDTGMGIDINAADDEHWTMLRAYAPWSINVELYDDVEATKTSFLAHLHDCGYHVSATLTEDQAARLAAALADIAPVVPLDVFHAERRAEKAATRAKRRADRLRSVRAFFDRK